MGVAVRRRPGLQLGVKPAHLAEQLQDVERLRRPELAVERGDIDHHALWIAPASGEAVERDVARRGEDRHAGVEALARLCLDVEEIVLHRLHAALVGDRAVARHHGLDVPGEDLVAGGHPVVDRAGPQHGMALDEQDVAGEDGAVLRHVDEDVAPRVRRSDVLQQHVLVADLQPQLVVEHPRRQACS